MIEQGRKLRQAASALAAGDFIRAESRLRRAIALGKRDAATLSWLGIALASQQRHREAAAFFREAAAAAPDDPAMHLNLGNALMQSGELAEALVSIEKAISLRPDYPKALNSLGSVLQKQGRLDIAIDAYHKALALDPHYAEAHNNLGSALLAQNPAEAIACFERAVALQPDYAEAHYNFGNALQEQHRFDAAIVSYRRALDLGADTPDAQYNLGLAQLFLQQFEGAWRLYEQRVGCEGMRERIRKDVATVGLFEGLQRWRGPAADAGRETVGIWTEQGIGDQLLFSSLIPELIAAGVPFIYEVDRRLLGAYERAFPGQRFVALSEPPHPALVQAGRALLAGSLPGLFRTHRADFARQPQRLLQALPQRMAHYRSLLAERGPGLKVALSWQSKREDRLGPRKSAPLAQFAPLLQLPGVHFVDVQYGDTRGEREALERETGGRLLHFDEVDYFNDLEELLAILEACDVLITTSNVNAHLAGALGQPVWLLYLGDNPPFHYWAHDGGYRSLWYPAVEIVSAPQLTEWAAVIRYAVEKLARLQANGGA